MSDDAADTVRDLANETLLHDQCHGGFRELVIGSHRIVASLMHQPILLLAHRRHQQLIDAHQPKPGATIA